MAINTNPGGHKGFQFNYTGVKATHMGDWNRDDYHSHQKAHPDKLKESSEKRAPKREARKRDKSGPKPETKVLDLSTGKKQTIQKDSKLQEAVKKDLANRGLNPHSSVNKEP